jgi:hypothetical protein
MEVEPQDQDIVRLLTKLKNTEGQYPEHMFVARRQMYLKQMTEIGLGIGADAGLKQAAKNPNPPTVPPVTSTLLETALLVAILVEASAVAYYYRDKLADFFQTITSEPRVQEVNPLPVVATSVEIQGVTPSPVITPTIPSATLLASPTDIEVTPTGTPIPGVADDNNPNRTNNTSNSSSGAGTGQTDSIPVPNANDDKQNQGNHYGQTPKPDRTIEPNSDNANSDQGNSGDPPPQDNNNEQAPGNDAKPTKAK